MAARRRRLGSFAAFLAFPPAAVLLAVAILLVAAVFVVVLALVAAGLILALPAILIAGRLGFGRRRRLRHRIGAGRLGRWRGPCS